MELLTCAGLTRVRSREIDHVTCERVLHTMGVRRDRLDARGCPVAIDVDGTVSTFVGELYIAAVQQHRRAIDARDVAGAGHFAGRTGGLDFYVQSLDEGARRSPQDTRAS